TEIVCAVGGEAELVGVTHEGDVPPSAERLPRVTRPLIPAGAGSGEIDRLVRERRREQRALYTLDVPRLQALRPDLIVTQALCEVCAVAEDEVRAAPRTPPGGARGAQAEPRTPATGLRP